MNEGIFRQKSIDRVNSPENLDEYIRVSNPGVWLLLVSVIVLLLGACVWGTLGHIDSTVAAAVTVKNGEAVCYIAPEDIASVRSGMTVRFHGAEATVLGIGAHDERGYPCILSADTELPDGSYDGRLVLESIRPLSLVLN